MVLSNLKSLLLDSDHVVLVKKDNPNCRYSICTVVNDVYLDFLYYFVKSALEQCKGLENIFILYTGSNFPKLDLYCGNKIKVFKHHEIIKTENIWDKGWEKNVELKTAFVKNLALNYDNPLFLIDVDCYFVDDFIDTIDMSQDLVICKRQVIINRDYIASFVGLLKPKACISFLDIWIDKMKKIPKVPKETLALCLTVPIIKKSLKVQELKDDVISCVHVDPPLKIAKILHYKGRSVGEATNLINDRFLKLKKILDVSNEK